MFFRIVSLLFILINLYSKNQVFASPVLLWSKLKFPQSEVPLAPLSSLNLISDYICQVPNKQIDLRIFAVKNLAIEDIQRGPQRDHPLLLDAKKNQENFLYFPNVDNDVYTAFSLIPRSNNMKCSHIHFEIISLKTFEILNDALNEIQTTIDNIGTDANNAVLIALINDPVDDKILSRQRRLTQVQEKTVLISNNKTCMFYAKQLYWNDVNGTVSSARNYSLSLNESSCLPNITPDGNYTSVILNLVWINSQVPRDTVTVSLTTTKMGRFWSLENATLNQNEYRYFVSGMHSPMETPPTYSYVCTTAEFVRYDNSKTKYGQYNFSNKFYIKELQFQPFNVNGSVFGLPNYCTSFFTRGIWMAITSSLLCLGILLFGIYHLMKIKSNDRFDDPKAKPLIIKAQE
ncbi:unnamed protein product [Rotaria sp. Silwood2]|nr:unnamed protein product [Rotaria sp. Silwood2]CAF2600406.1 unnamed protein product [Rotaria sp. Silwood2]CAF2979268.1 unnamed protein product [Rotaria sp. Silwood2]CAF4238006.1 unnamed protein product [Rotaria sp. Silwood2]CAF4253502.1 unnamed protein product [Rotaria sp. Silwood2]